MRFRKRLGSRGQLVIPKIVREHLGVAPGDELILEVRDKELIITPGVDPEALVEAYCSVVRVKFREPIELKRIIEEEVEERLALRRL